ncbi:MAG: hypothetical protein K2X47_09845 [Bdellovibrionales bacterium]|nr:hypothetical protein [Bdellovibrionales bacterium]
MNSKISSPTLLFGLFFVACILTSFKTFAQPSNEYLANSGTLELRAKPDWDAPASGKLIRGEPIKVLSHGEVWATVQYKQKEMFVPFALLSESSPWVAESRGIPSSKVAAHFRKKRYRSKKEIRDTLKNVQKKGALKDESEFIDDPELIAQLGGVTPEEGTAAMENPMDSGSAATLGSADPGTRPEDIDPRESLAQEPPADGSRPPELEKTNLLPSEGTTDMASREPAKVKPQAPQSFGPAVKKEEAMKFDLKSIRRMDKYKLTDKDIRRFRAQGKLTGD